MEEKETGFILLREKESRKLFPSYVGDDLVCVRDKADVDSKFYLFVKGKSFVLSSEEALKLEKILKYCIHGICRGI